MLSIPVQPRNWSAWKSVPNAILSSQGLRSSLIRLVVLNASTSVMLRPNDEAKLVKAQERYSELESLLADENALSDTSQYGKLAKEFSNLGGIIEVYRSYQKILSQIRELQEMIRAKGDAD